MNKVRDFEEAERIITAVLYNLKEQEDEWYEQVLSISDIAGKGYSNLSEDEWDNVRKVIFSILFDMEN